MKKKSVKSLELENKKLKKLLFQKEKNFEEIEEECNQFQEIIDCLREVRRGLNLKVSLLQNKNETLEKENQSCQEELSELETLNTLLKEDQEKLESQLNLIEVQNQCLWSLISSFFSKSEAVA